MGQKKIWSKKFGSMKNLGEKTFGSKMISDQKLLGPQDFWVQRNFGPNKDFGLKILGPKKFGFQKCWVKKIWVEKRNLVEKMPLSGVGSMQGKNTGNKTWSSVSNSSFVLDYKFWLVLVEGNKVNSFSWLKNGIQIQDLLFNGKFHLF